MQAATQYVTWRDVPSQELALLLRAAPQPQATIVLALSPIRSATGGYVYSATGTLVQGTN